MSTTYEITTITPLAIVVSGEVTESNLAEVRSAITERLAMLNLEPETDEEFGQAREDVKALTEVEKQFSLAKETILAQAEGIYATLNGIDECSDELRAARLKLSKAITTKTEEVRERIVAVAMDTLICSPRMAGTFGKSINEATKGKRTIESMEKAANTMAAIHNGVVTRNRAAIESFIKAHGSEMLMDSEELEIKSPDSVDAELRRRFEAKKATQALAAAHKEAEEAKAQVAAKKAAEASQTPPDAKPDPLASLPDPSKESVDTTNPPAGVSEIAEWEMIVAAITEAFAPLATVRDGIKHERNRTKFMAFRSSVAQAWKELNA